MLINKRNCPNNGHSTDFDPRVFFTLVATTTCLAFVTLVASVRAGSKPLMRDVSTRMENNDRENGILKEYEKELEKANC